MAFLVDAIAFLLFPLLVWRLARGMVPMAVLPILIGLFVAVAADRPGFDKASLGPSRLGEMIGWAGVLLLAFSAGLETRVSTDEPKALGRRVGGTALLAIALPFFVGFMVAASDMMGPVLSRPEGVSPALSAAAIGLCLAVSALPVLVGIVRELPAPDRRLGNLSVRIAAFDDGILWLSLGVLLLLHQGDGAPAQFIGPRQGAAVAIFVLMIAVRRRLANFAADKFVVNALLGGIYLCAGSWATTSLGLHELLGAYFAGVLAPARLAERLRPETMGKLALFGLSPLFFAHRGLSIEGSVVTPAALGASFILLVLAGASKLFAVHLLPPDHGMPATERTRLGLLLQCKGLMEIVAATILVEAGLITQTVFAILVTLALVSTTLTMPLFQWASRPRTGVASTTG